MLAALTDLPSAVVSVTGTPASIGGAGECRCRAGVEPTREATVAQRLGIVVLS